MSFKCKECGSPIKITGFKTQVFKKDKRLGFGQIYNCTNCPTTYVALKGEWYQQVLKPIEPLKRVS